MTKRLSTFLLLLFLGAMAYALVQLFLLRFETGDVYPPMSSLRSDPLGTMVLFESLQRLPDIEVRRDMHAGNRPPPGENTTYFHLGALIGQWREMPRDSVFAVERFLAQGGRLVVAFSPVGPELPKTELSAKEKKRRAYEKKKEDEEKRSEPEAIDIAKRWKYEIGIREVDENAGIPEGLSHRRHRPDPR